MAKNIILCSDGTGNSALKGRGTNVFKLYEAVDVNGHRYNKKLAEQIAFYDDGVGTESMKLLKIMGGAFGCGLRRNVKQLYTSLAKCYQPGDQIYLFGFSRGAFTVRQLAGFIVGCGIIDRSKWTTDNELKKLINQAFRKYRLRHRTWLEEKLKRFLPSDKKARDAFRQNFSWKDETYTPEGKVPIRFIGVWDTVAAVGLPFDHLTDFINKFIYRFKFPDNRLSFQVDKACHALAIDDERHSFHPELWDETMETDDSRIEQVWFPGVHSNIGGGYSKQGLSLVTMDWMMTRAEAVGLRFLECSRLCYHDQQNVHDKLYDSRTGLAVYYRYKVRDISKRCYELNISPDVHVSTFDRILYGTDGYAPVNLPAGLNIVATDDRPPLRELKSLTEKTNHAITNEEIILNRAKKWMRLRQYSHYLFILSTIIILYLIIKFGSSGVIESPFFNSFLNVIRFVLGNAVTDYLIKPILSRPEIGFSLVGFLILFYLAGIFTKNKIKKIYSAFWRKTMI